MARRTYQRGQAVSQTHSIPAPVGGLNATSAIANMPETDAIVMDNWFPQPSWVEIRNGYSNWATGLPSYAETILPYSNATTTKLFAISGTAVYDITAGGAVGAAVVTALTNARWEWTNIATSGGQFLYAGNAVDKPLYYDGAAWVKVDGITTPAITGVTTTLLRNPTMWKNRLWWVENNSMRAWYLPTSSVGGAASSFDFGPIFRLGGQLSLIATASLSDGSTFDQYICFISSEGEIAIYRGTDPAQAGLFNIIGVYRVGKPIGRRSVFKMGDDSVIICSDGIVSLEKLVAFGRTGEKETVSYKILALINSDVASYTANYGWEGTIHPLGNKVIINVPEVTNTISHQYVMNTITGSWCRFTGWNATTFCVQGNNLYWGGNTIVALADTTQADAGNAIPALLQTAYSYFGSDRQKQFKMCRLLLQSTGNISASLALNTDFQSTAPDTSPANSVGSGSAWNSSPWNTSPWAPGFAVFHQWQGVRGIGFAGSLYFQINAKTIQVRLMATDFVYEQGGVL